MYDLYGPTTYIGGSVGILPCAGVDLLSFSEPSDPNSKLNGGQLFIGAGYGFDVHVMKTNTKHVGKETTKQKSLKALYKQTIQENKEMPIIDEYVLH